MKVVIDQWIDPENGSQDVDSRKAMGLGPWTKAPVEFDLSLNVLNGQVSDETVKGLEKQREQFCELISEVLNHVHKKQLSMRDWTLLTGTALIDHLDRVIFINTLIDSVVGIHRKTDWVQTGLLEERVSATSYESSAESFSPAKMACLTAKLLSLRGLTVRNDRERTHSKIRYFDVDYVKSGKDDLAKRLGFTKKRFKFLVGLLIDLGYQKVCAYSGSHISMGSRLYLSSIGRIGPYPNVQIDSRNLVKDLVEKHELRSVFQHEAESVSHRHELSRNIRDSLVTAYMSVPAACLELFGDLWKAVEREETGRVRTVVMSRQEPEIRRFLCLKTMNSEAKLLLTQHGGFYGESIPSSYEFWEKTVSDVFIDWSKGNGTDSMPSYRLSYLKKKFGSMIYQARDKSGGGRQVEQDIVWWFENPLVAPGREDLFQVHWSRQSQWRIEALEALHHVFGEGLKIRRRPSHQHWGQPDFQLQTFLEARAIQEDWKLSLMEAFSTARLVVVETFGSTTFLECLAFDIPCLIVLPTEPYVREVNRPLVAEFRRQGILLVGDEGVERIRALSEDVESWWNGAEMQELLAEYRSRHAYFDADYIKRWKRYLLEK